MMQRCLTLLFMSHMIWMITSIVAYNPQPADGDFSLPMPNSTSMVFRHVFISADEEGLSVLGGVSEMTASLYRIGYFQGWLGEFVARLGNNTIAWEQASRPLESATKATSGFAMPLELHEISVKIPLTTEQDDILGFSVEKPTATFSLIMPQTDWQETFYRIQSFSTPLGVTVTFTDNRAVNDRFAGRLLDEVIKTDAVRFKNQLEFEVTIDPAALPDNAYLFFEYVTQSDPQESGTKRIWLTTAAAAVSTSSLTVDSFPLTLEAGQPGQAGPWTAFKVTLHREAHGDEPVPRVSFDFDQTLLELKTPREQILPLLFFYPFTSETGEVRVLEAQVRLREGVGQQDGNATLMVMLERSGNSALDPLQLPISWQAWMPQPKLWIEPEVITLQAGRSGSPGPFIPFTVHLTYPRAPETEALVAAFAFDARLFELRHQDGAVVIGDQQVPFKQVSEHEWQLPMQARLQADAVSREGGKRLKVLVRLPSDKSLESQLHLNWQPGPGRRWLPVVLIVVVGVVVVVVGGVIRFIRSPGQSRRAQRDPTDEFVNDYGPEVQSGTPKSSASSMRLPSYRPLERASSEPGHAAGVTSRAQEDRYRESSQRLHSGKKAAAASEVTPQRPQETVERLIQDQSATLQRLEKQVNSLKAEVDTLRTMRGTLGSEHKANLEDIVDKIDRLETEMARGVTQASHRHDAQQTQFEGIHDELERLRKGVQDKMDHLEQQLIHMNEDLQAMADFPKVLMAELLRMVLQDQTQIHTAVSQFFGISKPEPDVLQELQPLYERSVAIHAALETIEQQSHRAGDSRNADMRKVLEKSAQLVWEFEQYKQGYHNKQLDVLVTVDPYAPETIPERMAWSIRSAMQKMHDPMQYFSDKLDRFVCQDLVRVVDICDDGFPGTEQEDAIQRLLHASELEDISPKVGEQYDPRLTPVRLTTDVSRDIITKVERRGFRYKGKRIREVRLVVGK